MAITTVFAAASFNSHMQARGGHNMLQPYTAIALGPRVIIWSGLCSAHRSENGNTLGLKLWCDLGGTVLKVPLQRFEEGNSFSFSQSNDRMKTVGLTMVYQMKLSFTHGHETLQFLRRSTDVLKAPVLLGRHSLRCNDAVGGCTLRCTDAVAEWSLHGHFIWRLDFPAYCKNP